MSKSIQKIDNSKSGGKILQTSDCDDGDQSILSSDADGDIEQSVKSEKNELQAGKFFKAKGALAVIILSLLLIGYAFFNYLSQK